MFGYWSRLFAKLNDLDGWLAELDRSQRSMLMQLHVRSELRAEMVKLTSHMVEINRLLALADKSPGDK